MYGILIIANSLDAIQVHQCLSNPSTGEDVKTMICFIQWSLEQRKGSRHKLITYNHTDCTYNYTVHFFGCCFVCL